MNPAWSTPLKTARDLREVIVRGRQGIALAARLMGQMLKTTDDSALAAAATAGDREAFRRLVERHYDLIYRIAYRYVGAAADAEDIAQDVCVTLATKLSRTR